MNISPLWERRIQRRPSTPSCSVRPRLELLEDRTAPAAVPWSAFIPESPLAITDSYAADPIGQLQLPQVPFDATAAPYLTGPAGTVAEQGPTFSWTSVTGADHYVVKVSDLATGRVITDGQVIDTAWVAPSPFDAGHTYRTWVRAVGPEGTAGPWSLYRDVTIVHPMTGWYTGTLDGTMTTGGQAAPVSEPITFRVTSGGVILINSPGPGSGSVTFAGVAQGQGSRLPGLANSSYTLDGTFDLSTGSGEATGTWTATWTGGSGSGTWIAAQTSPAVLSSPTASGPIGSVTSLTPVFTWNAVSGADSYEVRLDGLTTRRIGVIDVRDIVGTTYPSSLELMELTVGHRYQWLVRAWRDNGTASGWSVPLPFTAQLAQPTLITPVGTQTDLSPTFRWTAVAGADTYRVQLNDLTTGQRQLVDQLVSDTSLAAPALVLGHRYQWTVQTQQVGGLNGPTAVASFLVTVGTPSAITPTATLLNARPTFGWSEADHADHYEVWVDDLSRRRFPAYRNTGVIGLTWTPGTALVPGDLYRWHVRGISSNGLFGPWSGWTTFTVTPLARPAPTGPSGITVPTRPTFTWGAVVGADTYDILVTDLTTGRVALRSNHVLDTSWTPTTPLPLGHRFRWQVRAGNASGNGSAWSLALTFTATLSLSANGASPGQTLTIRGVGFNLSLPTSVVFTTADGLEMRVPVVSPTATQVIVAVPPYVDQTTAQVGPGTVSVSVVQTRADGTTTTTGPISRDFAIADLPPTGVAPGTWTVAYLAEMVTLLDHTMSNYQAIGLATNGTVDVSQILSALQGWRDQLATLQAQVDTIRNGEPVTFAVGTVRDVPIALDADSLGLLDRMLAATFTNADTAAVPPAPLVALVAMESYSPEQEIWDQVKNRCREYVSGKLGLLEKAVKQANLFNATADQVLHGNFPLPNEVGNAFASVSTLGLFGAAVYYPWVVVSCLQSAANLLEQGSLAGLHAYNQSIARSGLTGLGELVVTHVGAAAHAGDLLDVMRQLAANGATAVQTYLTVAGPKIEASFSQALSKLRVPAATLDPPADNGFTLTAQAGGPNPTATLRISNTGEALSSLYCWVVSGPSGRVLVHDSTRHNLLVGESWDVPFEVNITGLDPAPHWQFDLEVRYYRRGVLQVEVVPVELNLSGIRLAGYVRNYLTRRAIAGATVQVVHNASTYTAVSAGNGSYRLIVPPEVRDQAAWVSVQVSASGYVDQAVPVNLALGNQTQTLYLMPQRSNVVLVEAGLHHLGDSSYQTALNAGLQTRAAEGSSYTTTFTLTAAQLARPYTHALLEITVNGAECDDPVLLNGHEITYLYNSMVGPKSFDFDVPLEYLSSEEANVFQIIAAIDATGVGLDDFEFSNVHLRLV